ncbi:Uncharacterised protein [Mycobacteroides abscessus subsp. abscessus]|nr:Uncharacterised protein [Mycobacteroides abscessus subsp. abscessus]
MKDHADIAAQAPEFTLAQRTHFRPVHDDTAGGGTLQAVDEAHQRALARSRVTDHGEHIARADIERHVIDCGHRLLSHPKGLGDVLELDQRCHIAHFPDHFSLRICCSILLRIAAQSCPFLVTAS